MPQQKSFRVRAPLGSPERFSSLSALNAADNPQNSLLRVGEGTANTVSLLQEFART